MDRLKKLSDFIFSSYKRTAGVLIFAGLLLMLPVIMSQVNQEQDIRQRASYQNVATSGFENYDDQGYIWDYNVNPVPSQIINECWKNGTCSGFVPDSTSFYEVPNKDHVVIPYARITATPPEIPNPPPVYTENNYLDVRTAQYFCRTKPLYCNFGNFGQNCMKPFIGWCGPSPSPIPCTPYPDSCVVNGEVACQFFAYPPGGWCPIEGPMCTMDAKICPDGTAVGRTGPNCEFAPCLSENPNPAVCGGIAGTPCPTGFTCQITDSFSDAQGVCVPPGPTCTERPACLDGYTDPATGSTVICSVVEPAGGFCPPSPTPQRLTLTPTPTCINRPLCLDSEPRCLLPEPFGGWCPATPTPPPHAASPTGIMCAQVITYAKNTSTGQCRTFPTACLEEGFIADQSCKTAETSGITPTSEPIPTATLFPTPIIVPNQTTLDLSLKITGIGIVQGIDNGSPLLPQRNVEVIVLNSQNVQISSASGIVTINPQTGLYTGKIVLGSNVPNGNYLIKVRMENTLWKQVPGIQQIEAKENNTLPTVSPVSGDINKDNQINLMDFNLIISCLRKIGVCK